MSAAKKGRTITWGDKISATKQARRVVRVCSIEDCDRPMEAGGLCGLHYMRKYRHGDPMVRLPTVAEQPQPVGADHPSWKGENIGYSGAHMRLRRARGLATNLTCIDCLGPAEHWSFNHSTPLDRTLTAKEGPYSANVDDWDPRCVSCHKRYDLNRDARPL